MIASSAVSLPFTHRVFSDMIIVGGRYGVGKGSKEKGNTNASPLIEEDWDSTHEYHIDLWTGSTTANGGDAQIDCENSLPGGPQTILRNPAADLLTDTTPFFSDGNCNRKTYDDGDSCSVSGGGASSKPATTLSTSTTKTAPAPTTTATTAAACSWEGHCLGAPCETYDDCSDQLVCTGGKCSDS